MSNLTFDPNVWYGIQNTQNSDLLQASGRYLPGDGGSAYFSAGTVTEPGRNWQFITGPSSNDTYAIRVANAKGQICLTLQPCTTNRTDCPKMGVGTWPCNSTAVSWKVQQWSSTNNYFIYNTAFGSDWALSVLQPNRSGAYTWITMNSTRDLVNQRFAQFKLPKQGSIFDQRYSSIPNLSTATASLSSSPDPTASPNNDTQASSASPSLGSGAIAGIVVGAVAALALVLAGIIFLLMRRRRQNRYHDNDPPAYEAHGDEKRGLHSEYDVPADGSVDAPVEAPNSTHIHEQRSELFAKSEPLEMPTTRY